MTAKRYSFQKLTSKDYDQFLVYYTQIEYSFFRDDNPFKNKEVVTKFLTEAIEKVSPRHVSYEGYLSLMRQGDIYLCRNEEDEVLGIILATPGLTKKSITIHEFFVLKKYQRKNMGTKMYQDFLQYLKQQGYRKVSISLMCPFEGAEEFWKKMGFRVTHFEKTSFGIDKKFFGKTEFL